MKEKKLRFVISGGGTGGHIFPAVSIANALKEMHPDADILFVGALGRMEMQRVPAAGYRIVGLPVRGLLRPLWRLGNIRILLDFLKSKRMVKKILRDFHPDVAIGVGGYASSATLNAAYELGVASVWLTKAWSDSFPRSVSCLLETPCVRICSMLL